MYVVTEMKNWTLNFVCLILAGTSASSFGSAVDNKDLVRLTLFYESYCPFSVMFIVKQLYPAWTMLKDHLQLALVPYGKAKETREEGRVNLTCHHGEKECFANMLHACAIHQACRGWKSQDCPSSQLTGAMEYINCVVQKNDQAQDSDQCAEQAGLSPRGVKECASGELGFRLELEYGDNPPIDYVPFLVINGDHDGANQNAAETDLKKYICYLIPRVCKNVHNYE